jgi:hypothetical protein
VRRTRRARPSARRRSFAQCRASATAARRPSNCAPCARATADGAAETSLRRQDRGTCRAPLRARRHEQVALRESAESPHGGARRSARLRLDHRRAASRLPHGRPRWHRRPRASPDTKRGASPSPVAPRRLMPSRRTGMPVGALPSMMSAQPRFRERHAAHVRKIMFLRQAYRLGDATSDVASRRTPAASLPAGHSAPRRARTHRRGAPPRPSPARVVRGDLGQADPGALTSRRARTSTRRPDR